MKKIILSFIAIFCFSQLSAQIEFQHLGTDWGDIFAQAKRENKMVFIDIYTDWCRPCKLMDKEVFSTEEAGAYFNEHFINVKANLTKGSPAVWLYDFVNVNSYPTFLYYNADGKLIHQAVGSVATAKHLIAAAEKAQDPNYQYFALKEQFEAGNRDIEFLVRYFSADYTSRGYGRDSFEAYFNSLSADERHLAKYWPLVRENVISLSSPFFEAILSDIDKYKRESGEQEVEAWLMRNLKNAENYFLYIVSSRDGIEPEKYEVYTTLAKYLGKEETLSALRLYIMGMEPYNMDTYLKYAKAFSKEPYKPYYAVFYNMVAWAMVERVHEAADLQIAQIFVDHALTYDPTEPVYKDTKACILYKLGKIDEAIALEKEVLNTVREGDYSEAHIIGFEETLQKMIDHKKLF